MRVRFAFPSTAWPGRGLQHGHRDIHPATCISVPESDAGCHLGPHSHLSFPAPSVAVDLRH